MVHAKAGALLGAVLKLTGFLMFVIPGMNSRILYTGSTQVSSHVTSYYCCFIMFLFLLHHTYTLVMTFYFCHTTEEVACSDPDKCMAFCNNKSGCTNIAYPLMVLRLLPKGAYAMPYRISLSIYGFFLGEINISYTYF